MSKLENNTASLQAVSEKINGVNNEINSQATTIAEIAALLEGKSVPGSGGGTSVETCEVVVYPITAGYIDGFSVIYESLDENNNVIVSTISTASNIEQTITALLNNPIVVVDNGGQYVKFIENNSSHIEKILPSSMYAKYIVVKPVAKEATLGISYSTTAHSGGGGSN